MEGNTVDWTTVPRVSLETGLRYRGKKTMNLPRERVNVRSVMLIARCLSWDAGWKEGYFGQMFQDLLRYKLHARLKKLKRWKVGPLGVPSFVLMPKPKMDSAVGHLYVRRQYLKLKMVVTHDVCVVCAKTRPQAKWILISQKQMPYTKAFVTGLWSACFSRRHWSFMTGFLVTNDQWSLGGQDSASTYQLNPP